MPTPTLTPALNHESCPSSSSEYQPSGYCMLPVFISLLPSLLAACQRNLYWSTELEVQIVTICWLVQKSLVRQACSFSWRQRPVDG
jgi:hypothetical protein